jgi:mono/diheme cytochrome c family protein
MKHAIVFMAVALMGCGRPTHTPQVSQELKATSQSLWSLVFNPRCVACHNPSGQARFLDLSSPEVVRSQRDRLFGEEKLIDESEPANSYLIKVILDPVEPMPPISSGLTQLNKNEITAIEEWIRDGLNSN